MTTQLLGLLFLMINLLIINPLFSATQTPKVQVGIDVLMGDEYTNLLKGKKIGLITNQSAMNRDYLSTVDVLKANAASKGYTLVALFGPEHGINGAVHANELIKNETDPDGIPIYSLHGKTFRPTSEMLKGIDLLLYDIQDIGSRSYTYSTTLYYAMEEAAKFKIPVVVLDRPNPINGIVVDGPMMEEKWRSLVGYINVPYCHGMTIGELAQFFNAEYRVNCNLKVIPMKGWQRSMTYADTGLPWIPTSPNIPEASTAFYYPTTGILGELQFINIGIGYTLPFKIIGAPWIDAIRLAKELNAQKFPGVFFRPFYFCPFYGKFKKEECQGVQIFITDPLAYRPVTTQYLIIGMLKSLYPEKFQAASATLANRKEMFSKINGTDLVYRLLTEPGPIVWKLRVLHQQERQDFMNVRKKYLISSYGTP